MAINAQRLEKVKRAVATGCSAKKCKNSATMRHFRTLITATVNALISSLVSNVAAGGACQCKK
jgi:hypothetical protein